MKPTIILLLPVFALAVGENLLHAAPAPRPKAAATKTPSDPGWPREATADGALLTVYQPQLDEWKDSRQLKARAAFVLTPKDGQPVIGVTEVEGRTTTDIDARTVLIRDLAISSVRFPSLPEAEVAPTEALFRKVFPGHSLTVSLDRLAAGVERAKDAKPLDLKMDSPQIFVSTVPGVLLLVEGKPVLAPVKGTKLEFVVNTNWDVFHDPESSAYYLLSDTTWLTAPELDGEWALAAELPAAFAKIPKGEQWDHVKKAVPAKVVRGQSVPYVYYAEQPAELIAFDGNPLWQEVEDTHLLWAKNTESWVFDNTADRQIYYLVSGRWFRAAKWEGPWTYSGNDLPEDFKLIPPDSPCADVLASVPGTPEAADAVLLAEVPQEAVIKRKEAEAKAQVTYDDNTPDFAPIESTSASYATNTSSDVIRVDDTYYLCQDAVWFQSAQPAGPWMICVDVPAVIYTIPPAYPVHRVTYVRVEIDDDDDDVVVCRYTAGYFGAFIAGVAAETALVWGTGYYYPPFVAWAGPVPIYRPWPATYGVAAAYNPWTGGYAVGGRAYGPYASAGRAAWYNPVTGNYGRAARVTGPYGSRTVAAGYNPRHDNAWATRQSSNGYAQWGSSAVRRGDDWVRAGHVIDDDGGVARWRGSEGGGRAWRTDDHSGGMARHDGDVYAGRDGNVYRRDDGGNWAKYHDGDWESLDHRDQGNRLDRSRETARSRTPERPAIRPGADGGGERRITPEWVSRPDQNGSGQRRIDPGNLRRPGQAGGGQQRLTRDDFVNRAPARRAEIQPSEDVRSRLSRDSAGREFSGLRTQQHQSFQRSGGAPQGSRSFGGHTRGGGVRRR